MKVLIFGKDGGEIVSSVKALGFSAGGGPAPGWEIVDKSPDFVISYGGDGTLVRAEYNFPGIPKIVLKNSVICKKCQAIPNEEVLEKVSKGNYKLEELWKLEAETKGKILRSLYDITIHNADPRHAIRYGVFVNGMSVGEEIIGDGVVISTPFGSTGYYHSITDSFFEVGIGLAFNNSIEQSDHMVLKEDSRITIKVARGPVIVYADNQLEMIELKEGDEVIVKKSKETAKIVRV